MKSSHSLLFDDSGNATDSRSLHLRSALNAMHLGENFVDYVVRNLGFIESKAIGTSVHIRLRPAMVSPVALASFMYWLADRGADRVLLSSFDAGAWTHAVLGSGADAAPKIARLVSREKSAHKRAFLSRRKAPCSLPNGDPLRALIEAREALVAAVERADPAALAAILEPRIGGRYSVSHSDSGTRRLLLTSVGRGYETQAGYWIQRIIGYRLNDLPDPDYGIWAAEAHLEALRSDVIRVDEVDAIVTWPSQNPKRYRYRRLLLPLQREDAGFSLLSATIPDPGIDLRSDVG